MRRRSLLGALAAGVAGSTAGCVGHPLPPLRGIVTRKRIVAEDGTLLAVTGSGIDPRTRLLRDRFPREPMAGNTTITERLAGEIRERHGGVDCRVTVRHRNESYVDGVEPGEKASYHATRSTFNQVMTGDGVGFQVGLIDRPKLLAPSEIVRSGRVVEKRLVGRRNPDGRKPTEKRLLTVTGEGVSANRSRLSGRKVGGQTAERLLKTFDALVYRLVVEHGSPGKRLYGTERPQFDRARVGETATFKAKGDRGGRIAEFVDGG
jgi:hypothetical protein